MATWQEEAAAAARAEHVDPVLYQAVIRQESGGNPNAVSPSGALGYSQLMPETAKALGVDPRNPQQNLRGGARYLAQQLKTFGGDVDKALAAYNAGPGAVQKYGGIPPFAETQKYVKSILAMAGDGGLRGATARAADPSGAAAADLAKATATGAPRSLADLGSGGADAVATLSSLISGQQPRAVSSSGLQAPSFAARPALASATPVVSSAGPARRQGVDALISAARTPGAAVAAQVSQSQPLVAEASSGGGSGPSTGTGGAQAALGWAESKVGFKETGNNSGGLASYLNDRFGFKNAPWCAMFTSAAVTKGGAPASARTASVAEVRRQAEAGGGGYQKGFVGAGAAKQGDLILFGDDHIGMVQRVAKGKVYYVGGNQSDGVTEASVPVGHGDIVRPRYGSR